MVGYALFRKNLQVEESIVGLELSSDALPSSSAVFGGLAKKKSYLPQRFREGIFAGHG